jgi:hypothetical protein
VQTLRHLVMPSLAGLLLGLLAGCPDVALGPDAGDAAFDAGNPSARDACSGGCAENQRCDGVLHECVDACGGCEGSVCVKGSDGTFACQRVTTSCGASVCADGEIACVGGACACVAALNGSADSCQAAGGWCDGTSCAAPAHFEQCQPGSATARCPTGNVCAPVFGADQALCVKDCSAAETLCERGERCARISGGYGCLPLGLFANQECSQHVVSPDGGLEGTDAGLRRVIVPVSNTCLVRDTSGAIVDEPGRGTGNCTYALFKFWDQGVAPRRTCRPSGTAKEGDICRADASLGTVATQCGPGLECMPVRNGDQGVCFRMCNANPASGGFTPEPSCGAGEACVNLYRQTDPNNNAVVGVCLKTCDVFDAARSACALVAGHIPTSCVPTAASGEALVSPTGAGVCVPHHPDQVGPHAACRPVDPFRGAACGDAQLCQSTGATAPATCLPVCDLECSPVDGGAAPARCATEPSARCEGAATCHPSSSSPRARVGLCW